MAGAYDSHGSPFSSPHQQPGYGTVAGAQGAQGAQGYQGTPGSQGFQGEPASPVPKANYRSGTTPVSGNGTYHITFSGPMPDAGYQVFLNVGTLVGTFVAANQLATEFDLVVSNWKSNQAPGVAGWLAIADY